MPRLLWNNLTEPCDMNARRRRPLPLRRASISSFAHLVKWFCSQPFKGKMKISWKEAAGRARKRNGVWVGVELSTGNDPIWRSSAVTPTHRPRLTVLTAGCRHVPFVISAETQSASGGSCLRGGGAPPAPPPRRARRQTAPCPNTCNYVSESEGKSGKNCKIHHRWEELEA